MYVYHKIINAPFTVSVLNNTSVKPIQHLYSLVVFSLWPERKEKIFSLDILLVLEKFAWTDQFIFLLQEINATNINAAVFLSHNIAGQQPELFPCNSLSSEELIFLYLRSAKILSRFLLCPETVFSPGNCE